MADFLVRLVTEKPLGAASGVVIVISGSGGYLCRCAGPLSI